MKPLPRHLYVLVMAAAGGSAFLGFLREAAVGAFFGATAITDAYYAALTLPFLLTHFLVGGALAPPLTVAIASRLELGDGAGARALFGRALSLVTGWGLVLAIALSTFAAPLAGLLVPGFAPEQIAITAGLLRILLAYGLLTSLGLILTAGLTAAGSYRSPAIAALASNLASVALLLLLGRSGGIQAAAWSMVLGAGVLFGIQLARAWRLDLLPRRADTTIPLPLTDTALLMLSLGAAAAVDLAERSFASSASVGAITILAFASKLVHLPMRLFAAPLASVALPRLARRHGRAALRLEPGIREAGSGEARGMTARVVTLLLFAASMTAGAAGPIVALTFRRGRFDAAAAAELAGTLALLAPAVVAVGTIELAAKLLVASGRTRAVAFAQGSALAAYLILAPFLSRFGVHGLALCRDISWGLSATLLYRSLISSERLGAPVAAASGSRPRFVRLLAGTLLAGLAASVVCRLVPAHPVAVLALASATGALVFAGVTLLRPGDGPPAGVDLAERT